MLRTTKSCIKEFQILKVHKLEGTFGKLTEKGMLYSRNISSHYVLGHSVKHKSNQVIIVHVYTRVQNL